MEVELIIGGILLTPLIVAAVDGAKELGLPTNYARLFTGILTVLAYGLMEFVKMYPEYEPYVVAGLTMVGLFFTSTGLYSNIKKALKAKQG